MSNKKKLIFICGPTAVGKTDLAFKLAKNLKTEIISADSRQIYKELKIGTCPPNKFQMEKIKHHFIHYISINEKYSAGDFGRDAKEIINNLFFKYDNLIVVGGSGLYLKAISDGIDEIPPISEKVKKNIREKYCENGINWLKEELIKLDPKHFKKIDSNNPQRLMRSLEVFKTTGKSISSFQKKKKEIVNYKQIKIGIKTDRNKLYNRINERVDLLIKNGLFSEVKKLYSYKKLNALNTVGYKELIDHIEGKNSFIEAVNLIKQNSRRYAKRQITWFKKDKRIIWFEKSENLDISILKLIQSL